ncbi:hypothetical protein ACWT_5817 [Actinoplanes sp. SE50]|uniref:hypothetical protein n=1 Tax=unclassified Actinoplanes TaxID=2626549 RepID=UPI00023EBC14|nr:MULTISPECIES: hypothetical protein [unclassified Actinoplanes]AEV86835.1 hypothetical protein ACPL_5948 [Actinoplanes sp. SE50/110]ATO85232.1 hypothetical protein ACWT_5817 [Actinoplanes sp. SE50]SLM02642.1 hypothetical protein ACSP50_5924 [Actinoplanes sp. SE50/110]
MAWHFADETEPVTGIDAARKLRACAAAGNLETALQHDDGRLLVISSNGDRALVMSMDEPGDPGQHAIDPGASGEVGGYLLSNGQEDRRDNQDTIAFDVAVDLVREMVDHDRWLPGVQWMNDRG